MSNSKEKTNLVTFKDVSLVLKQELNGIYKIYQVFLKSFHTYIKGEYTGFWEKMYFHEILYIEAVKQCIYSYIP